MMSKIRMPVYGRLLVLFITSTLFLSACGDSKDERVSEGVSATKLEPIYQPHDWQPETRHLIGFGDEYEEAIEVAEGIYQSRGTSNMAMIVTEEGNILIDTGLPPLPGKTTLHKRRLGAINDKSASHIILTHAHADHYGGTDDWQEDNTEVIVHREFLHNQQYLKDLVPYFMPRNKVFFPEDIPDLPAFAMRAAKKFFPIVEASVVIDSEPYEFTAGGEKFIVYHTPGAEGYDNLSLWMPSRKILFTGDVFGHMFGMWPNLTTIRGERARFTRPYIDSLNLILELEPEMLIPSHFYPVKGADYIKRIVTKTRDAVQFVDDAVIEGMNDGKDVYTLMREIKLPEELQLFEAHGKVSWGVKSIWHAYTGWFYMVSPNEMYEVPVSETYKELVSLAGGSEPLLKSAQQHLDAGELEKSIHFIEMVQKADPDNEQALQLKAKTLDAMITRANNTNHYESMFLKKLAEDVREQL